MSYLVGHNFNSMKNFQKNIFMGLKHADAQQETGGTDLKTKHDATSSQNPFEALDELPVALLS